MVLWCAVVGNHDLGWYAISFCTQYGTVVQSTTERTPHGKTILLFLGNIHDNARLLELPPEREADVRRAGGESGPDTLGDGQPGVRGLRAAAAGHAAHQPRVVRRERHGQLRRMIRDGVAAARRDPEPLVPHDEPPPGMKSLQY